MGNGIFGGLGDVVLGPTTVSLDKYGVDLRVTVEANARRPIPINVAIPVKPKLMPGVPLKALVPQLIKPPSVAVKIPPGQSARTVLAPQPRVPGRAAETIKVAPPKPLVKQAALPAVPATTVKIPAGQTLRNTLAPEVRAPASAATSAGGRPASPVVATVARLAKPAQVGGPFMSRPPAGVGVSIPGTTPGMPYQGFRGYEIGGKPFWQSPVYWLVVGGVAAVAWAAWNN